MLLKAPVVHSLFTSLSPPATMSNASDAGKDGRPQPASIVSVSDSDRELKLPQGRQPGRSPLSQINSTEGPSTEPKRRFALAHPPKSDAPTASQASRQETHQDDIPPRDVPEQSLVHATTPPAKRTKGRSKVQNPSHGGTSSQAVPSNTTKHSPGPKKKKKRLQHPRGATADELSRTDDDSIRNNLRRTSDGPLQDGDSWTDRKRYSVEPRHLRIERAAKEVKHWLEQLPKDEEPGESSKVPEMQEVGNGRLYVQLYKKACALQSTTSLPDPDQGTASIGSGKSEVEGKGKQKETIATADDHLRQDQNLVNHTQNKQSAIKPNPQSGETSHSHFRDDFTNVCE